jgi:hypothetical protein
MIREFARDLVPSRDETGAPPWRRARVQLLPYLADRTDQENGALDGTVHRLGGLRRERYDRPGSSLPGDGSVQSLGEARRPDPWRTGTAEAVPSNPA